MENVVISNSQFVMFGLGAFLAIVVPLVVAIVWKVVKKERFTTILIGAAIFLVFAIVIEKLLQNALLMTDNPAGKFINSYPVLLAFVAGLFPGLFEETGRFFAFKTLLKKRTNRETSISYGIGHGGFEVMFVIGMVFVEYIVYAVMINTGTYGEMISQAREQIQGQSNPLIEQQMGTLTALPSQLAAFGFAEFALTMLERVIAVLFHIGASILVFYACKDKKKVWLYPLAIALHTLADFVAALYMFGVVKMNEWIFEGIFAVISLAVFFGGYFLLYRKDKDRGVTPPVEASSEAVAATE